MEKEFKKIAQETEQKYEEIKGEYKSISKKYADVMQKLSSFASENKNLTKENEQLKTLFAEITSYDQNQPLKLKKKTAKSTDKSKPVLHYNPSNYIKLNCTNKKVYLIRKLIETPRYRYQSMSMTTP